MDEEKENVTLMRRGEKAEYHLYSDDEEEFGHTISQSRMMTMTEEVTNDQNDRKQKIQKTESRKVHQRRLAQHTRADD